MLSERRFSKLFFFGRATKLIGWQGKLHKTDHLIQNYINISRFISASFSLMELLKINDIKYFQTQRFTMEYQKIPKKSTEGISLWRGFARYITLVYQRLEPHRFETPERRDGVCSSEFLLSQSHNQKCSNINFKMFHTIN